MLDEVHEFWLALHKPEIGLRTFTTLADGARKAIRSHPRPQQLPPWTTFSRSIVPSVELVHPSYGLRLAFRDPASRAIRNQHVFVNTFATSTSSGVVASFEFTGASKNTRLLCNADTREWLHQNARAIEISLADYFARNQILIHNTWLDEILCHQLRNLDHLATLHLEIGQIVNALTLLSQPVSVQAQYMETAGLLSIQP